MLWIIILLCLAFITLCVVWYTTPESENIIYPTIHARCQKNSVCGGDLVCDLNCHRCKKQAYGDCASDVDCESGLLCVNWQCVDGTHSTFDSNVSELTHIHTDDTKSVRWREDITETYLI